MTATLPPEFRIVQKERADGRGKTSHWVKVEPEEKTKPRASTYLYGHPEYVVPTSLLRDFIEAKHNIIQSRVTPMTGPGNGRALTMDEGWRDFLSHDAASILRTPYTAVVRRLYDVMHGRAVVVNAAFADAIVMAMGFDLDRDTNIPVLPGNRRLAKDLVAIRAEDAGVELTDFRIAQHAKRVFRLSRLIARYPHHHEMLRDMAPFNCLRPPQ